MEKNNSSFDQNENRWETIKRYWQHEYTALWVVPGLILGLILGFILGWMANDGLSKAEIGGFIENFTPELLGIGITIMILYYLDKWRDEKRDEKRLKHELLWQVCSQSNETAKTAVDRLRVESWLEGENGLLQEKNLRYAKLQGARLTLANMKKCNLSHASLQGAILTRINFEFANLEFADLSKCHLPNANLSNAKINNAQLNESHLWYADLTKADLQYAELSKTQLNGAILCKANLNHCNLQNGGLLNADLRSATLVNANLSSANLAGANLQNVDLTGSNLRLAYFTNALFNENTILPDGQIYKVQEGLQQLRRFIDPRHYPFWRSNDVESPAHPINDK